MSLDPVAIRAGVRLETFDTLGSTNAEALARARNGEPGPLWIVARAQSAGRGRRGRAWVSEPGNLYATLLLTDPSPPRHAAELSFVAALALADAVQEIAPRLTPRVRFKWPNDLLLDGAKFSGILVEGESGPQLAAAIGIGVNCAHHPAAVAWPATDLTAAGCPTTPENLLTALSRTMLARLAQWDRGNGFAAIRADWLGQAADLGRDIRVAVGTEEVSGRFADLDAEGHLVLERPDGTITAIPAGDVFPAGWPASVPA